MAMLLHWREACCTSSADLPGALAMDIGGCSCSGRVQAPAAMVSKRRDMKTILMRVRAILLIGASLLLAGPALAGPNDVHAMVRAGEIMPFEAIQRRVMQETPGEYMGAQFDQSARIYRFRFLRDGNLINVDVDARTGERVRRRQNY